MSITLLRRAVSSAADDPEAILQALDQPWPGALSDPSYTELLVVCALKRKTVQIKTLRRLGADLGAVRRLLPKPAPQAEVDPWVAVARARHAAASSINRLTDPLQIHVAVLQKLRGQLASDRAFDGANSRERVAFKGHVVAHLESVGSAAPFLPDMKRSLVRDARACGAGYRPGDLAAAFAALRTDEPTSFFWSSITGSKNHAIDVVVRATRGGFVLTSCNRGDGAAVEHPSGKAAALQSVYADAQQLASALAPWTVPAVDKDASLYNFALHDRVMPFTQAKPIALDYRPQKLQKAGNCATKSLFAAVSYLTGVDQETLADYKAMRRSFDTRLTGGLQRAGAPTA